MATALASPVAEPPPRHTTRSTWTSLAIAAASVAISAGTCCVTPSIRADTAEPNRPASTSACGFIARVAITSTCSADSRLTSSRTRFRDLGAKIILLPACS
jgi:hypothetical protein